MGCLGRYQANNRLKLLGLVGLARVLSFCWHPLSIPIETPVKGRGKVQHMPVLSPTARSVPSPRVRRPRLWPSRRWCVAHHTTPLQNVCGLRLAAFCVSKIAVPLPQKLNRQHFAARRRLIGRDTAATSPRAVGEHCRRRRAGAGAGAGHTCRAGGGAATLVLWVRRPMPRNLLRWEGVFAAHRQNMS